MNFVTMHKDFVVSQVQGPFDHAIKELPSYEAPFRLE